MELRPMVVLRAVFVGGIVAFAKVGAVVKAAGGAKVGVAVAGMTAAATAAVSGTKLEGKSTSQFNLVFLSYTKLLECRGKNSSNYLL